MRAWHFSETAYPYLPPADSYPSIRVSLPNKNYDPETGFLERIKEIAEEIGAVLIFDEVTSGWRLNTGGVHLIYGVSPHVAVFAKAMANGHRHGRRDAGSAGQFYQQHVLAGADWTNRGARHDPEAS